MDHWPRVCMITRLTHQFVYSKLQVEFFESLKLNRLKNPLIARHKDGFQYSECVAKDFLLQQNKTFTSWLEEHRVHYPDLEEV